MALLSSIQTSLNGMKTAQNQLDIIGRNVSNVDTEGYTRKTAQQNNKIMAGYHVGVQLADVKRNVNSGLLRSYLASNSLTTNLSAQNEYLSKTEVLLGTPEGDNSIAANVANLQANFDTFAADVTSAAGRYTLLTSAQSLTSRLNSISLEIQKLRGDADIQISATVDKINATLDSLAELNDSIVKYSVLGYEGVPDLEDQRDLALKELSSYIDISYFKRENGELVIQTKSGATLLDSEPHKITHSAIAQASPTTSYAAGSISGIYIDGKDITNSIRDGEIKGLIQIRDVTLPSLQGQLDELAGSLKDSINQVHNQGTAYPNTPSELSGTRTFLNPAVQSIKIEEGDVRFVIFDESGQQVSTASLKGDIGFYEGTLDEMATQLQNWLRSVDAPNMTNAEVYFDNDGKIIINTQNSEYSIGIIDGINSNAGATQQDVRISFDADGNNTYDREFSGFSSFFGLNDFFVSAGKEYIYDSKVLSANANLGLKTNATISFSDSERGIGFAQVVIETGDSLQDIVNKINSDEQINQSIRAALVPNGNGYVLRIEDMMGVQLEISELTNPPTGILNTLGMAPSNAGISSTISVREDMEVSPERIANGAPVFNSNTGKYELNQAANNIANAMAKVFATSQNFAQTGTIGQTDTTLANYASTFVGNIASATANSLSELEYQQSLTTSISLKEAEVSGVDLDEELAQMIIYQQTYAACAQAFTASKEILDLLLDVV